MTPITEEAVSTCAMEAAEIAALASIMATQLLSDLETGQIGEAVGGLGTLARRLSNKQIALADPNA